MISNNDLVISGIERLIKRSGNFSIQKTASHDENEIIRHIQETTPEAVILDGSFEKNGSLTLLNLLNRMGALRLLVMQIDSNHIQIYEKHEASLEQADDLALFF